MTLTKWEEEGATNTQELVVRIDGGHKMFHGEHTPGICQMLRDIADALDRTGVQLAKYPFEGDGFHVDLIETSEPLA